MSDDQSGRVIEQIDGTFDTRLGPHRVPQIKCTKCGTSHSYHAANGEYIGHCRNCWGFLRRPTQAEHDKFSDFLVWKSRHFDADTERGETDE